MKQLLADCQEIMDLCRKYGKGLSDEQTSKSIPSACFVMISNKAILTFEVLSFYLDTWTKTPITHMTKPELERIRLDNAERCVMLTRQVLFLGSISIIEHHMRNMIALNKNHPLSGCINRRERLFDEFETIYKNLDTTFKLPLQKFRNSLKDIPPFDSFWRLVEESVAKGYLPQEHSDLWFLSLRLRNCLVHNNGIPEKDFEVKIDGRAFLMKADVPMRVNKMDDFTFLMVRLMPSLNSWFNSLEKVPEIEALS